MALKNLIAWFTGDDSSEPEPSDTSPVEETLDQKRDSIAKMMQWRGTSTTAPDAAADALFANARGEMDRMLDELSKNKGGFGLRLPSQMFAASDLKIDDTGRGYCVSLPLPGFAEKDIKIEARDAMLTVTAEQRSQHDEGDNAHRVSEQFVNRFQRVVPLARAIDPGKVTSTFDNGVLRVTLQKR